MWRRARAITGARYAGHSLGWVWHVLEPVALIAVYSVIFGIIIKRQFTEVTVPYPVYLCAGILPWLYFAQVLGQGCGSFRANRTYLRKLAVSEQIFVGEVVISGLLTLAIQLVLLGGLSVAWANEAHWTWLMMPIPVAFLAVTGFGLALALATLNAFFPDVKQTLGTVLRLAIWGAPVVFPKSFYVEHGLGAVIAFNPATPAITACRDLFIDGRVPEVSTWLGMLAWAVGAVVIGLAVYRPLRHEIKDVV